MCSSDLAVDPGDYILANRLPVPWVMQQLGFVLGDFPDVQLRQLSWRVDTPPSGTPQRPRSDNGLPVPIPMMTAISAELTAEIRPFDGDLRAAFARIEALADAMQARTEFEQVATVEYPVDASPAAAIAGEIAQSGDAGTARFRLRLYYPLLPAATAGGDDAI